MKYFFLLVPLLFSCSFYSPYTWVTISGLGPGRIVVSNKNYYEEIDVSTYNYDISLEKGMKTFVTFYPEFYGREGRFPYGACIDLEMDFITVSPHLGLLTKECNNLNRTNIDFNYDNVSKIKDLFLRTPDPWIYDRGDIVLYLVDEIGYSSISYYKTFLIPELNKYFKMIPENKLLNSWYPSIQSFYNNESNSFYRLDILENSSYTSFVEVKK